MRIETIEIKNFRAIRECKIDFDDYLCLVGTNGVGKSTVLAALNVFFGYQDGSPTDIKKLVEEDFFRRTTNEPVRIKVTFSDLSDAAKEDLAHYVRNNKLIVIAKAVFDGETAEVKQFGVRLGIRKFIPFFEGSNATEKRVAYEIFQKEFDLPAWTSAKAAEEVLRHFEETNESLLEEIESESQFYGFTKGTNKLEPHIQWVYVPAVKDASTEEIEAKNTAFGKLLSRAVRSKVSFSDRLEKLRAEAFNQYEQLMREEDHVLQELAKSLEARLHSWGNPRATVSINWFQDPNKFKIEEPAAKAKTGEQGFEGSLARAGHGLQRSYLISLLQELASINDDNQASLLLAIEEPELYQHPPQARHLAAVLQRLSERPHTQVVIATHSPYFVSGRSFENVRIIRRDEAQCAYSCSATFKQIADAEASYTGEKVEPPKGIRARLDTTLQSAMNEMLFTDKLVLVEGIEDFVILSTWLLATGLDDDARRLGISIVPSSGKKSLLRMALVAEALEIPTFVVFDGDAEAASADARRDNAKINNALFRWAKMDALTDFPSEDTISAKAAVWFHDIQKSAFTPVDQQTLETARAKARAACGEVKKLQKNTLYLSELMSIAFEERWELQALTDVCEAICSDTW